ncbi:uncharacterized protein LOC114110806 isoform X1 [Ovis aries]|uniref:uncharacterized protein LOC114110806 isoform X1 n=1 Tax=Ovis aries TaxID=9940 RepID=UPI0029526341|nr:uncharacterized protein LOC114110806 isoform X1 [Ovis aries]
MVGLGALGSREPVCTRAGGRGRGPGLETRFPPLLTRPVPRRRRSRVWDLPSACSRFPLSPPHSSLPHFCLCLPLRTGTENFLGNRRNFSGCGCAACIRINPALRHPAGNGSRFPGVEAPHPLSSGREVAPRAQKAAGLASEGGWTISALGLSSLSRSAVPGSPHPLPVLRKPARAESARGEN